MPQTVTLVPINHPDTGEPVATGSKVTMSEEAYNHLRSQGAVAASDEEVKANAREATSQGVYDARTGREDTSAEKKA